jgi:hypothetical protein
VWTSLDGTSWGRVPGQIAFADGTMLDVVARPGELVASGYDVVGAVVWATSDGLDWHRVESPSFRDGELNELVVGPGGRLVGSGFVRDIGSGGEVRPAIWAETGSP